MGEFIIYVDIFVFSQKLQHWLEQKNKNKKRLNLDMGMVWKSKSGSAKIFMNRVPNNNFDKNNSDMCRQLGHNQNLGLKKYWYRFNIWGGGDSAYVIFVRGSFLLVASI